MDDLVLVAAAAGNLISSVKAEVAQEEATATTAAAADLEDPCLQTASLNSAEDCWAADVTWWRKDNNQVTRSGNGLN